MDRRTERCFLDLPGLELFWVDVADEYGFWGFNQFINPAGLAPKI
jgi:hypothetical protein